MASEVEVCNRALQKLGAKRISSLTQDSANARACNACYEALRDVELSDHFWNFSIERAALAADGTGPSWGRTNSFTLPSDFLSLANDYPEDNSLSKDWVIEGQKIVTDDSAPLYIRYVKRVTDVPTMHPLFREALACRMAIEMCEELTQSNQKKAALADEYKDAIRRARKMNAFQVPAKDSPDGSWITERA